MSPESSFRNRRVLVTGAGGFIGSHLVEALVGQGATVRAMVHYSSRADAANLEFLAPETLQTLDIVRGDIRDPYFAQRACESVDVIFHLAALIGIPYSYEAPAEYVATNVTGTLNVLEAARRQNVERVVHTSTSEVYGTAQYRPIDEKHPLCTQSPYAASKLAADKLAESYHCSFGLPVVTVRPFNTFGPRQSGRAVTSTIFSQLLSGCECLNLGSLEPERDLTFVSDTVAGMLALGACEEAVGKVVNLGTGTAYSVGDIARMCMAVSGREVPLVADPSRVRPRNSEVMALVSNNGLARSLCGWRPLVTIDEGLQSCAEFVEHQLQMYHPQEYQR
jgi:NAD dependent epimerase/dehydratase